MGHWIGLGCQTPWLLQHILWWCFFFQEYFYLSFSSSDVSNSGTPLHKGDKVEFYVATDKRYNVYFNLWFLHLSRYLDSTVIWLLCIIYIDTCKIFLKCCDIIWWVFCSCRTGVVRAREVTLLEAVETEKCQVSTYNCTMRGCDSNRACGCLIVWNT